MVQVIGPHKNQEVRTLGVGLNQASAAMILMHGRNSTARAILMLAEELSNDAFLYLAPQAAENSWYPYRFMEPIQLNEPWIASGFSVISSLLGQLHQQGIAQDKVILLGFSQGACLVLEYAARHPARFGGIVGLSGGLMGPPGTSWKEEGWMEDTLLFLGCDEHDLHIPRQRVLETAQVFKKLGARVTTRIYPDLGHTVNQDEIHFIQKMMDKLLLSS